MKTVWHIRGEKAGAFEKVSDEDAEKAKASGNAQIADGSKLELPEGHPHYIAPEEPPSPAPAGPVRPKKKYANKMETTDPE